MNRPAVLHIANTDWFVRHILLNQLLFLQEKGYEVVAVSPPGPNGAAIQAAGIRHIAVPMRRAITPVADLIALRRLCRVLCERPFAIVHTHNPKPGLLGQLAARLSGVPVVINTLHGFYFHDRMDRLRRRFYVAMEKVAARFSDVILSQNREDIQTAIGESICRPGLIKHLGNGIDLTRFRREGISRHVLDKKREELGLPSGAPVVGFVGRLVAEKGVKELLAAARLVLKREPKSRLLIIGPLDREKPDSLTPAIAQEFGLADSCIFAGMREDMPELYSLMDVFALPSHREGFPRSLMEASAMGVPCVATDIRGCREVIENGRTGVLVPPGNVEALAAAIIDILAVPARARNMGQEGRRLALERFDERVVFTTIANEYSRLLKEKGHAAPGEVAMAPAWSQRARRPAPAHFDARELRPANILCS